jgi:hypothetical protein
MHVSLYNLKEKLVFKYIVKASAQICGLSVKCIWEFVIDSFHGTAGEEFLSKDAQLVVY